MSPSPSLFSEKSQKAILAWGLIMATIYFFALLLLFDMVPTWDAGWSAERIAEEYSEHNNRIKWGAVVGGWCSAFMMPILAVVCIQMARVETGGAKIWSALSLVSGALMSLFLMLPTLFWGTAAYTKDRVDPEVTAVMHELGSLTLTTTDQYYIFMWIGITVICFRSATAKIPNNPFPRWWGYLSLWITFMFEAGAFAFVPRSGPLAWDGLLVFWSPLSLFGVWIAVQSFLVFRALNAQIAAKQAGQEPVAEGSTIEVL